MGKRIVINMLQVGVLTSALMVCSGSAQAGGVTYENGDKYIKLGGRIQFQYHYKDPDPGDASDSLFFRRFRPFIEGSVYKNWKGKIQWDMGKADGDNELSIKDAFMEFSGIKNLKIALGNKLFPFSREGLTSSKKQQLVERTFVGDHNYGSTDRNLGIHMNGKAMENKLTYGFSVAQASLDPDSNKLDFDTPVNKSSDFNEGWMAGGRVDLHPFGLLKFSQGDFKREVKATVGVGAYYWGNDKDNISHTTYNSSGSYMDTSSGLQPDVDTVSAIEISGGIRGMGFSADAQFNSFNADTLDSNVTSGIYKDGSSNLKAFSFEGGYMAVPSILEVVAGYQALDADNYSDNWTRTSFGINWYLKKHDIKTQLTYRVGKNLKGVSNSDEDELFLQAQYVF